MFEREERADVPLAFAGFKPRSVRGAARRAALVAFIALAASATPVAARHHADPNATGLAPIRLGKPAPDFAFAAPAGMTRLSALRGRTVVINFWATYCGPCLDELDAFARLPGTFGDAVTVLAVSDEDASKSASVLTGRDVRADVVADPGHLVFDRYGVTPIPTTIVIAPDGTVTHVSVGELDWPELEQAVAADVKPDATVVP